MPDGVGCGAGVLARDAEVSGDVAGDVFALGRVQRDNAVGDGCLDAMVFEGVEHVCYGGSGCEPRYCGECVALVVVDDEGVRGVFDSPDFSEG